MPEWIEIIDEYLWQHPDEKSESVELLVKNDQHALYRITHDGSSFVVKWFKTALDKEMVVYLLLQRYGVPTIPVYGMSDHALLMEDLAVSTEWRLATAEDIEREETGIAVAAWYAALHTNGKGIMEKAVSALLPREVDSLTPDSIMDTGKQLGLTHLPCWQLAAENIEQLAQAFQSFPVTLNYNDFHWTNLALSRGKPMRAIVFDYHLLGIGPAYCDFRNVSGSLVERARAAFRETYRLGDEYIADLDAPLSLLYSLQIAAQLLKLPGWAMGCLQQVASGEFEELLNTAVDATSPQLS